MPKENMQPCPACEDASQAPARHYHYRCFGCGRVFVTLRPVSDPLSPDVRCPACIPADSPLCSDEDRRLNKELGFPRHLQ